MIRLTSVAYTRRGLYTSIYMVSMYHIQGGATGYVRYALAYLADPACIGVYILYLKKKRTLTCRLEN